jgi:protein-disulfide isomerase
MIKLQYKLYYRILMKLPFQNSILMPLAALVISIPLTSLNAADDFNDSQRSEIKKIVQSFIMKNPQIILDAVQQMQTKAEKSKRSLVRKNLIKYRKKLMNDPNSPTSGNPKGDVTIIEFFDYRCGYCKRVLPTMLKAVKEDGNVRIIYKELPILGAESVLASRASLAAWRIAPEKYEAFHTALMANKGSFSELKIRSIASDLTIDGNALIKGMESDSIGLNLAENQALAQSLGISGTPAFIVGEELVPGAVDIDTLKNLIKAARGS